MMFFPEVGHGPWLPLRGESAVLDRGRALMRLHDEWLKEIVDLLRGAGRLERTVIAVTADHGVRTRAEDPAASTGEISDYMCQAISGAVSRSDDFSFEEGDQITASNPDATLVPRALSDGDQLQHALVSRLLAARR